MRISLVASQLKSRTVKKFRDKRDEGREESLVDELDIFFEFDPEIMRKECVWLSFAVSV